MVSIAVTSGVFVILGRTWAVDQTASNFVAVMVTSCRAGVRKGGLFCFVGVHGKPPDLYITVN